MVKIVDEIKLYGEYWVTETEDDIYCYKRGYATVYSKRIKNVTLHFDKYDQLIGITIHKKIYL